MLMIRESQMAVFQKATRHTFEEEMVVHLARFSPLLCKAAGAEQTRQAVQFGIDQAESHGFTFRGPVRLYLELMLLFGSYFDTDPQYPWATEILTARDLEPQMQRAERLYEKTIDYREKVFGTERDNLLKALRSIQMLIRQPPELSLENFIPAMQQEITYFYPQKAAYVGAEGLEALIRKGVGGAQRQQFSTVHGMTLVVLLMFTLGHGCGADPLYPWIAQTLKDTAITEPNFRAKQMEVLTLAWFEQLLAYFSKAALA